jgi:hypothetical protein
LKTDTPQQLFADPWQLISGDIRGRFESLFSQTFIEQIPEGDRQNIENIPALGLLLQAEILDCLTFIIAFRKFIHSGIKSIHCSDHMRLKSLFICLICLFAPPPASPDNGTAFANTTVGRNGIFTL